MKQLFTFFIFITSVSLAPLAQGQSGDHYFFLTGILLDKSTHQPVPYASLGINNSKSGTAADGDGIFQFKADTMAIGQQLVISSIGYKPGYFSIDSLRKMDTIRIFLQPSILFLNEVFVKAAPPDPAEIIQDAIRAIPNNFKQDAFNLELYSKITVKDSSKTLYTLETILSGFRNGYIPGSVTWTKVLQKRETGKSPLSPGFDKKAKLNYFPNFPSINISLIDQVGSGSILFSVFNPSIFKRLKFRYAGVSRFNRDTVCAIEYSLHKSDIKNADTSEELDGKYTGVIWIAVNNLAIVRHSLKIGNGLHEIIYKRTDGYYYPYFMKTVTERTEKTTKRKYRILDEVMVRSLRATPVQVIINQPENWYAERIPYNEVWWSENFIKNK